MHVAGTSGFGRCTVNRTFVSVSDTTSNATTLPLTGGFAPWTPDQISHTEPTPPRTAAIGIHSQRGALGGG